MAGSKPRYHHGQVCTEPKPNRGGKTISVQPTPILERGRERLSENIERFLECSKICDSCAMECLGNADCSADMIDFALLCLDCAEICRACPAMHHAKFAGLMTRVCAEVCEACAAACDKGEEMGRSVEDARHKCAEACRQCAESCRAECLMTDSLTESSAGGLRNPSGRLLH